MSVCNFLDYNEDISVHFKYLPLVLINLHLPHTFICVLYEQFTTLKIPYTFIYIFFLTVNFVNRHIETLEIHIKSELNVQGDARGSSRGYLCTHWKEA